MRKVARLGLYGGIVAIVLGLSKVHARWVAPVPYSWHTSDRFVWSICYMAVLIVASYGVGLPDLVKTRRATLFAAIGSSAVGAGAISLLQLSTGSQLLPRFVVFGTALALVPWGYGCAVLARVGRRRGEERDRVLVVGSDEVAVTLADDLGFAVIERPATLAGHLDIERATSDFGSVGPVEREMAVARASVVVLDNLALADERVVSQAASLHESGVRVRSLLGFYEQWLGKLPVSELERASLLFDIGEVHRARFARIKRLIDVPIALLGCLILFVSLPFVAIGDLVANRESSSTDSGGWAFAVGHFGS